MAVTSQRRRRQLAALLVGYFTYTVGLLVAAAAQPTGYEISIYRATPVLFWLGSAIALLAAIAVGLRASATTLRSRLAMLLGALVGITVAILPIIRDYYYNGSGDALSYLGWTRLIAEGELNPANFLYPGINPIAVVLTRVTGLPPRRTLQLVVPVFMTMYVLFTALCVTRLAVRSKGAAVGMFFALLFLPINNIHTYIFPYPTTAAIYFTPFALYLLLRYVGERETLATVRGYDVVTPLGVLLILAGIAAILIHPQSGSNILLLIAAGFGLQLLGALYGRYRETDRLADHRSLAPQTAVVGLFFLLWIPRFDRATGTVSAVVNGLLYGANPGDEISTVSTSLSTLGSGIGELFVKIFLVSAVLSAVAGVVMFLAAAGRLDECVNVAVRPEAVQGLISDEYQHARPLGGRNRFRSGAQARQPFFEHPGRVASRCRGAQEAPHRAESVEHVVERGEGKEIDRDAEGLEGIGVAGWVHLIGREHEVRPPGGHRLEVDRQGTDAGQRIDGRGIVVGRRDGHEPIAAPGGVGQLR